MLLYGSCLCPLITSHHHLGLSWESGGEEEGGGEQHDDVRLHVPGMRSVGPAESKLSDQAQMGYLL